MLGHDDIRALMACSPGKEWLKKYPEHKFREAWLECDQGEYVAWAAARAGIKTERLSKVLRKPSEDFLKHAEDTNTYDRARYYAIQVRDERVSADAIRSIVSYDEVIPGLLAQDRVFYWYKE